MRISYDISQLEKIIENIYCLTGVSLLILDADRKCLASRENKYDYCARLQEIESKERCAQCDVLLLDKCTKTLKLEKHICHEGLYDSAFPIIKNNLVVGYVLMGRVRSEQSPDKNDPLYNKLPFMTEKQLFALYGLIPTILFSKAIEMKSESLEEEIVSFIENNLQEDLSIKSLCSYFHLSKNSLYRIFHKNFNSSVNEYVITVRLNKAKELLSHTQTPVCVIAEKLGFDTNTYFFRLFKARFGITPKQYREEAYAQKHLSAF